MQQYNEVELSALGMGNIIASNLFFFLYMQEFVLHIIEFSICKYCFASFSSRDGKTMQP